MSETESVHKLAEEVLQEVEYFQAHLQRASIAARTAEGYSAQLGFQREGPVGYLRAKSGDKEFRYVLCRSGNPGVGGANGLYLSYKAPVGRLASLSVGQSVMIPLRDHPTLPPTPTEYVLIAKDLFRTQSNDAVENQISPPLPELYVPSLRDLLSGKFSLEDKRPRKRPAIEAISLRDQIVVDTQQDPLFRLPMAMTLVISGSPGTGKTTVMIKRIAMKTSQEDLLQAGELSANERVDHLFVAEKSWVLFTPTELLKNYIKESLGREGMAATEQTVRIWKDYRNEIARDFFRLLKVGKRPGAFRRVAETEQVPVRDDKIRLLLSRFEEALQRSDIERRVEQRIEKQRNAALARKKDVDASVSAAPNASQPTTVSQRLVEYLRLVPKYYKLFRRRNSLINEFYRTKPKAASITDHELDIVILVILRRFRLQLTPQLLRGDDSLV